MFIPLIESKNTMLVSQLNAQESMALLPFDAHSLLMLVAGAKGNWVQVSSSIYVLNLVIKLQVQIAENYRLLDQTMDCIATYKDAYMVCLLCMQSLLASVSAVDITGTHRNINMMADSTWLHPKVPNTASHSLGRIIECHL